MAASALALQLQAIALSHVGTSTRTLPRGKPSMLFDAQEAANIDLQTIYRIGKQGEEDSNGGFRRRHSSECALTVMLPFVSARKSGKGQLDAIKSAMEFNKVF
jgi:hypothetical protein